MLVEGKSYQQSQEIRAQAEVENTCRLHPAVSAGVDNSSSGVAYGTDNSKLLSGIPSSQSPLPIVVKEECAVFTRKPSIDLYAGPLREKLISTGATHDSESAATRFTDLVTTLSVDLPKVIANSVRQDAKVLEIHNYQMSEGSMQTPMRSKPSTGDASKKSGQGGRQPSSITDQPTVEDYEYGVVYSCKYIGSMSMMKPKNKHEILGAMRRVRFEYKARNTKKKKILMEIGVNGVKVLLNKRRKKTLINACNKDLMLMEEPICHIFFVSHDSQDNKIFSYISKKNPALSVTSSSAKTNAVSQQSEPATFHCHVFKAYKKSQAVLIVHGIGRIFELCNDMQGTPANQGKLRSRCTHKSCESESCDHRKSHNMTQTPDVNCSSNVRSLDDSVFIKEDNHITPENKSCSLAVKPHPARAIGALVKGASVDDVTALPADQTNKQQRKLLTSKQKSCNDLLLDGGENDTQLSQQQEIKLLWLQLEQQEYQIEVAVGQTEVLRQQVAIEAQSRNDAEMRCHQLLLHNKDLLEHINRLAIENKQLRERLNQQPLSITEPVLASSHTDSRLQEGGDGSRSVKTSPDSGHKEMSTRSSHSDIIESWEKLNVTLNSLATPTNSSYQLSSKFENEKLQKNLSLERDLSFTDIAKHRLSQSQLTTPRVDQSQHSMTHYASNQNLVKSEVSANGIPSMAEPTNHVQNKNGSAYEASLEKFQIPGNMPTAAIPYSRTPNASKLLCTLMMSEHEDPSSSTRCIKRIKQDGSQSRSLTRSVNDIYDKMKVIRRSLECMESSVGQHISKLASSPADEFTPQRKSSVNSSTPTSQVSTGRIRRLEENLYAEVSELKQELSAGNSRSSLLNMTGVNQSRCTTEEQEKSDQPLTANSVNQSTSTEANSNQKSRPITAKVNGKSVPVKDDSKDPNQPITRNAEERCTKTERDHNEGSKNPSKKQKKPQQHYYENVGDNFQSDTGGRQISNPSLSRNDTYIIRKSAFDLHKPSHLHQSVHRSVPSNSHLRSNARMSKSCHSLSHSRTSLVSLRYTVAPQKVTTLSSPPTHSPHSTNYSGYDIHKPTAVYCNYTDSSHLLESSAPEVAAHSEVRTPVGTRISTSTIASSKPSESSLTNGKVKVTKLRCEFLPIISPPGLAMSRDSLNSSIFEAELDKRLDKLVALNDTDWGQSSC